VTTEHTEHCRVADLISVISVISVVLLRNRVAGRPREQRVNEGSRSREPALTRRFEAELRDVPAI
jgi:hypothetical protein